jgi:hypothetical protein
MNESTINRLLRLMAAGFGAALLAACGGGGASDTDTSPPQPPTIIQQPASTTVIAGQAATFAIQATGAQALAYRWQLSVDGITWSDVASNSNGASHTTAATTLADNGASYRVTVSNAAGLVTSNVATLSVELPLALEVNFNSGSWNPLVYTSGRTDSPADADPAYAATIQSGALQFSIPASTLRPKLSGFLDMPTGAGYAPISGDLIQEFTFTDVAQLLALGADSGSLAIAGSYVRGTYSTGSGADWSNGDAFGGFWFGFVRNPDGSRQNVIRTGASNLVSEPFSATQTVSYRIVKRGTTLELFRRQDGATAWTRVGAITITVRAGGSAALAISHVRVLNNSNGAVAVNADDFRWYY